MLAAEECSQRVLSNAESHKAMKLQTLASFHFVGAAEADLVEDIGCCFRFSGWAGGIQGSTE